MKLKINKLGINKKIRLSLMIVLLVAVLVVGYLFYNSIYSLEIESRKVALLTYKGAGAINYTVYLKPNNLYTEDTMGEGKLYITEFVDHINADFKYNFTSEDTVNIKGNYDIVAKVQGFIEERDKEINIWEKVFPVIENKEFSLNENKLSINESLYVNLDEYNAFAAEIIETSKIKGSRAKLILAMDVNLHGATYNGEFENNVSPNLIIPLGTAVFRIIGDSNIEKSGVIEDIVQVELPVNRVNIIFYGTILGIFILTIMILLFFTKTADAKDPLERELKGIFKKHGDRLVALDTDIEAKNSKKVQTIEDLVRLADEMNRPIFYKHSKEYKEINNFYITNGNETYVFNITEPLSQDSHTCQECMTDDPVFYSETDNMNSVNEEFR